FARNAPIRNDCRFFADRGSMSEILHSHNKPAPSHSHSGQEVPRSPNKPAPSPSRNEPEVLNSHNGQGVPRSPNRPALVSDPQSLGTPHYSNPPPLGRYLNKLVAPIYKKNGFFSAELILDWKNIVGEIYSKQCRPVRISGLRPHCCLYIGASKSVAAQLTYVVPQLLERIRLYFGSAVVESIRFVDDFMGSDLSAEPNANPPPVNDDQQGAQDCEPTVLSEDLQSVYPPLAFALNRLDAAIERDRNIAR
ncbi:MAG: DUF721 domain-containing protein, partial [Holosporales bacterium]|nr:DUF721 domain-containing protein [Holosporales bacterium]